MQCPRDGRILVRETFEGDVRVDRCPACFGIWVDEGELELIQATLEHDYAEELKNVRDVAQAYALVRQTTCGEISCPACGRAMAPQEYCHSSQILVDQCPDCGGSWLDAGELEALEVFFERAQEEDRRELRRGFLVGLLNRRSRRGS